ncbi:MAG: pilin [Bdellovibrionales bacterium]|nr:pilin [Bdellovibrionales bacterium]
MKKSRIGFTLIELMIVVSIIGILAGLSVPAFNKYLKKAKMVDAYTAIDAIQKAQMTAMTEYDQFISLRGMTAQVGKKSLVINPIYTEWGLLGNPIPQDATNYFAFVASSGFIDPAGNPYKNSTNAIGVSTAGSHNGVINAIKVLSSQGVGLPTCPFTWSDNDLGILYNPGLHYSVILGGTRFSDEADCTFVVSSLIFADNKFSISPLITIN